MNDRSYRGKRVVDITVLVILAVPAAIASALCALAVKLTSEGPIIFRQERAGLCGTTFRVFKFRTMANAEDNPIFPDPSRVTSVGRLLRRLSLDELPQLLNVALGEMSIVGPRPTLPYQIERYTDRQRERLSVRPGLTGWAQVRGRNEIAWAERIEHDLEYIERQSPLFDLRIMSMSARAVFAGGGVEGHPTDDPIAAPPDTSMS